MKRIFNIAVIGFVFFALFSGIAFAEHQNDFGSANLTWNANAEEDGVTGYKVYQGSAAGAYGVPIDVGNVTEFLVPDLPAGTFFWAITAYDGAANESGFSNEVNKTIAVVGGDHTPPAPPSGLDVVLLELAKAGQHIFNVITMLVDEDATGLKVE